MIRVHLRIGLLTVLICLACLAASQADPPTPPAEVCNVTSTKPTPSTRPYILQPCIVAKFAAYLTVAHNGSAQYVELKDGAVNAPISNCESTNGTTPKLVVNYGECGQLDFDIAKNNASEIYVRGVIGFYKVGNETIYFSNTTGMFKTTGLSHYYKCNSEQTINFNNSGVQLVLSNFAYEAYREATGSDFYKIAEECALDSSQVSDLVRIGVGVCLVALVVIVLIAYFVGRRRWSERSSYESV